MLARNQQSPQKLSNTNIVTIDHREIEYVLCIYAVFYWVSHGVDKFINIVVYLFSYHSCYHGFVTTNSLEAAPDMTYTILGHLWRAENQYLWHCGVKRRPLSWSFCTTFRSLVGRSCASCVLNEVMMKNKSGSRAYVIANLSTNHEENVTLANEMIEKASVRQFVIIHFFQ